MCAFVYCAARGGAACECDYLSIHKFKFLYFESPGKELVLDFQEVASVDLSFKRFIEDCKLCVVLDVLPTGVTVSGGALWSRRMTNQHKQARIANTHNYKIIQRFSEGIRILYYACQEPVVMATVPDLVGFLRDGGSSLLILPQGVKLCHRKDGC